MKKSLSAIALLSLTAVSFIYFANSHAQSSPPAEGAQLFEWLSEGNYKEWSRETEMHPSAGPHPTTVIAYFNSILDQSMSAGADSHPEGAAAVKELYNADGVLSGWAVSIKTAADSQAGQGWYWYEILGTNPDSRVVANANGVPLCFGCHTPGKDFVLTAFPLQ